MSRLTVNAAQSGYTDEIVLDPNDFTVAAGNTTTLINIPVKKGDVVDGAALEVTEAFAGVGSATFSVGSDASTGTDDVDSLIVAIAVNALNTVANTGDSLDGTTTPRLVCAADGNLEVVASTAIGGVATAGKARLLLSIKRIAG